MKIKSANTAVYATPKGGVSTLGDDDPAFYLPVGATVDYAGDAVKNAHNVLYTPVSVSGHGDELDVFWVRSTSVLPDPTPQPPSPKTKAKVVEALARSAPKSFSMPIWGWVSIGVVSISLGFAGYRLLRKRK